MSDPMPARPATVSDLGLMRGSPPADDALVTSDNWWKAPYVRWSFLHTREVVPSALVSRGDGPNWELPRDDRDLLGTTLRLRDRDWSLREVLETTYVDGLMVVRSGRVMFEHYGDGMGPRTRHLCQSVSKSLAAALAGVLIGDGRLELDATVPDVIEELRGTCWDDCTIEHLLDMCAGVAFDESDYEDPASESWRGFRALGWMPPLETDPSPTAYIASMRNQAPHGGDFEYRSILTDVLGWVIERATGEPFAEVFSREVWAPMGAAADADLLLGPAGFPLVDRAGRGLPRRAGADAPGLLLPRPVVGAPTRAADPVRVRHPWTAGARLGRARHRDRAVLDAAAAARRGPRTTRGGRDAGPMRRAGIGRLTSPRLERPARSALVDRPRAVC
jgi:CubicO group peptidase (beta-lactamase class C family)